MQFEIVEHSLGFAGTLAISSAFFDLENKCV